MFFLREKRLWQALLATSRKIFSASLKIQKEEENEQ